MYKPFLTVPLALLIFMLSACTSDDDINPEDNDAAFELIISDMTYNSSGAIFKVDPDSGIHTLLTDHGRFGLGPADVTVDENGIIYVAVAYSSSGPPEVVMVDPEDGTQTTISSGDYLKTSIHGIAADNSGNLLVTKGDVQLDRKPRLLKIDIATGEQTILSEGDKFFDVHDVATSEDGDIYVLGKGIMTVGSINYAVTTVFKIDPGTGEQHIVFQIQDRFFNEIEVDGGGSILVTGKSILRINPNDGSFDELIASDGHTFYNCITVSRSNEIYIVKTRSSFYRVGRVEADSGFVTTLSTESFNSLPTGMSIRYP